jgi:hypothetical protein|tara:strand:- start:229 stop:567 length:339 start_codon:yes stop_codon:yes gene_type:complete
MENQLIDVEYEDGFSSIAKILKDFNNDEYEIASLEYYGDGEWDFDIDETSIIKKNSVSGFYDTTKLEATGLYEKNINGMYSELNESDDEFELYSSDEYESESDISLCDEEFL